MTARTLDHLSSVCTAVSAAASGAAPCTQGDLLLLELKATNRELLQRAEQQKLRSLEEKERYDANSLQLHNLLYEKSHYQREIARCHDFASRDEDAELVSLADFERTAPAELRGAGADEHQLRLNRLTFELRERQRLSEAKGALEARKELAEAAVAKKRQFLNGLPAQLDSLLAASQPLQEAFQQPAGETIARHSAAMGLPSPLYVLFSHMEALRDGIDPTIGVEVLGDAGAGEEWLARERQRAAPDDGGEAEGGADADAEGEGGRRKKKAKVDASASPLAPFPIAVQAMLPVGNSGTLRLTFRSLPRLGVVTVETAFEASSGAAPLEALGQGLMQDLYPGDSGLQSPNPANVHALESIGWSAGEPRPFRWAQWAAGLYFTAGAADEAAGELGDSQSAAWAAESGASQAQNFHAIVRRLRARVRAMLSLHSQMDQLRSLRVSAGSGEEVLQHHARLTAWASHEGAADTAGVRRFQAELTFGEKADQRVLSAVVSVDPAYPAVAPSFELSVGAAAQPSADEASRSDALLQISAEINARYALPTETDSSELLMSQVCSLLSCLGVHGSTLAAAAADGAVLFCERPARGRGRRMPMTFNANANQFE